MKLNGWPRICVVASVAWTWWSYGQQMEVRAKAAVSLGNGNYRTCEENLGKIDTFKEVTCRKLRNEEVAAYMDQGRAHALFEAVKPVALTWLVAAGAILIVSLVRTRPPQ